ncbi:MAG: hypothetical protein QM498_16635 [Desulfobacterium sp.]
MSRTVTLFLACMVSGSFLFFLNIEKAVGAMRTVFYPILYVSGHYSDNKDQTELNKKEEYYTTYGTALSLRFIQESSTVTVIYNPEFNDRSTMDDGKNSIEHNASLQAHAQASPRVIMDLNLVYDGHDSDVGNESWEHTGRFTTTVDFTDKTRAELGLNYVDVFQRQQLSGEYREHVDYGGSVNVIHRFGQNNQAGVYLNYSIVDYKPPVTLGENDYRSYGPTVSLSYWFSHLWGMDGTAEYEKTDYDVLDDDVDTWSGNVRLMRRISPRLLGYAKYEHIYSDRKINDVTMYIPSVGFAWDVSEDTGISLGAGYIFQEWDTENNGQFFMDADVFKGFDLSRHTRLHVSATSGIDPTSDVSSDFGFQVFYQSGFLLTWQMRENLSANLRGAWSRDEFIEPVVNRIDTSWQAGAGLTWSPWRWGDVLMSYGYEDFNTDSSQREDYQEHRGTLTFQVHPTYAWDGGREESTPEEINQRIYND